MSPGVGTAVTLRMDWTVLKVTHCGPQIYLGSVTDSCVALRERLYFSVKPLCALVQSSPN